ncbi:MAG TPA: DinB family protein [Pyrinomonadaceae bacterium]|nr:DinB family protein [Pyrinomonadaceae bacterium]
MRTLNTEDFTNSLFQLLRETFEAPPAEGGSAYLDKGAGLFQTLDALTAEAASAPPRGGGPTVAAHCEHARFYVHALLDFMRGATAKIDWSQSWVTQTVSPGEWERLKEGLRRAYATLDEHLRSLQTWGDEEVGDSMAILVHTAYHLGAIRQIVKDVNRQL